MPGSWSLGHVGGHHADLPIIVRTNIDLGIISLKLYRRTVVTLDRTTPFPDFYCLVTSRDYQLGEY